MSSNIDMTLLEGGAPDTMRFYDVKAREHVDVQQQDVYLQKTKNGRFMACYDGAPGMSGGGNKMRRFVSAGDAERLMNNGVRLA